MKKCSNKSKYLTNTVGSLLILGALSGCSIIIEQTNTDTNEILERNNSNSSISYEIQLNSKFTPEEFNKLGIKKGDSVLVLYEYEKGDYFIVQERFSERQLEYPLVKYSKEDKIEQEGKLSVNYGKIFIAPNEEEFNTKKIIFSGENIRITS